MPTATKVRATDREAITFKVRAKGDLEKMRQELRDGTATGEVEIIVAVFGIQDTNVAFGNTRKQTIDKGAFRTWIDDLNFEEDPPLGFIDHGDATITGQHSARLMIGYASEGKELDEGLWLRTHYNLEKTVAREAYSDLLHNPAGVQFSFGWDPSLEKTEVRDGVEHVTQLFLTEWSQVAFGAQRKAGAVAMRAKAKSDFGGESLDSLPRQIRSAWYDDIESIMRKLGRYAWVEEVFATNNDGSEGYVVAAFDDGRGAKIDWAALREGGFAFEIDDAEEIQQEWVATGKSLTGTDAERAAALAIMAGASALADASKQARTVASEFANDPMIEFYRTMNKTFGATDDIATPDEEPEVETPKEEETTSA